MKGKIVILVLLVGYLGYEGVSLWVNSPEYPTISRTVWEWSDKTDLVAFLFGLLMGHFFWPRKVKDEKDITGHSSDDSGFLRND